MSLSSGMSLPFSARSRIVQRIRRSSAMLICLFSIRKNPFLEGIPIATIQYFSSRKNTNCRVAIAVLAMFLHGATLLWVSVGWVLLLSGEFEECDKGRCHNVAHRGAKSNSCLKENICGSYSTWRLHRSRWKSNQRVFDHGLRRAGTRPQGRRSDLREASRYTSEPDH